MSRIVDQPPRTPTGSNHVKGKVRNRPGADRGLAVRDIMKKVLDERHPWLPPLTLTDWKDQHFPWLSISTLRHHLQIIYAEAAKVANS